MLRRIVAQQPPRRFLSAAHAQTPPPAFQSVRQVLQATLGVDRDPASQVLPGVCGDDGWRQASSAAKADSVIECRNPATGKVLARVQSVRGAFSFVIG